MKRVIVASVALLALSGLSVHATDMKDMPGMKIEVGKAAPAPGHKGQGTVNRVDEKANKVYLAHGPIPSLNWPAMTMDFVVKDKQTLAKLKPGQKVAFVLIEQPKGQYVITEIAPLK